MCVDRVCIKFTVFVFVGLLGITAISQGRTNSDTIEQWGIFEVSLNGPSGGNPFVDVELSGEFRQGESVFEPEGFYDGDGVYRIRFMPDSVGQWSYVTKSNQRELDDKKG